MRPDPQHQRRVPDSGTIIYLGDVRRRRAGRRLSPDRYYLAALALVAAMSWGAWLTVVMSVAPSRLLSYVAFLLPLAVAVTSTAAIGLYAIDWRRGKIPSISRELRRAALLTAAIEVNLAFLGARSWLIPVGVVSIAAIAMVEIALSSRRR